MPWLHVKYDYFKIILNLFQCIISHVTTSETERKLFRPPKKLQNHFTIISATMDMLENRPIYELQ